MKGLFSPRRGNGAPTNLAPAPAPKKDLQTPQISPLEKRLQDMGPIRGDGSDKFFGMENCLYYSVPFREAVINYPQRTPVETLEAAMAQNLKFQNPNAHLEAEALAAKQKAAASAPSARQAGVTPNQPQKPEDKDSPEYKKKVALQTLPLMDTKSNAESYGMSESLFTSLKDIFESLVASQTRIGVTRPQQFLEVLRREHEMFRTAMHQDAHEFLNLLLNEVVANVEAEATKQAFSDKAIPPPPSESAEWVHELFEGTLTSETKCLTCEKVSQRDEVFLDLSVDLEQHSSVTACLRKFSAEEMLCERNKFHCDNCGGLQEAEKRMKIKRLPRVLALHLKRFKYTEDLQRLQKLFHRVVYPYHLRLFNTTDDAEDPDRLYELYAVVVHIGGGPYHGHYVAIIKTEDRGWLLFDDELVEPVDKNYVRNFFGDKPGLACAYVLFYQETTLEAVMREQAQEDAATGAAAAAAAAAVETGDLGKSNGYLASPNNLMQVHSASYIPSDEPHRLLPISKTTTAPQLEPHYEQAESDASSHQHHVLPSQAPLPPVPDERLPILTAKKSDVQSKKEKAREEKERRAAEKEREKSEKARRKEVELQHQLDVKREADELRRAIEASKADAPSDQGENGSPRKSSSFNFLRRGSRSLSHRLSKDKDSRGSVSDLAPLTVPETPVSEDAATTDPEPFSPRDPLSPKDASPGSRPSLASRVTMTPPILKEVKEIRNEKAGHTHRWRSLSFRKTS
ncbi:putative ubiquitin carboxyl-terminal hydrolase creB [Penicillium oxalicum]|uniref:putative ubiquitin carboxyl-terminal hydrolase creB n=1 Tax=Penicillium oxalicum TaxID=69781 RepID=UPI0020B6835C|nr:putative ubiquitin carboxyl-terminal hydrolase creB [Penicillium oxalicum]KAI2795009.1 putative ubiquitin carboxyl-terminal hydrolase creB [Penicillium oxalicum]